MKSIRLHYSKSTKEQLLKYGGSYEGFASIYRYSPFVNKSVLINRISSEFISGDERDAMYHFDSIVKNYSKNLKDKSSLLSYKIDKIIVEKKSCKK